ncbi:MAG: DUF3826 domain-containing protein [Chitinophagaceae bacterium]
MNIHIKKVIAVLLPVFLAGVQYCAAQTPADYRKVVTERSAKIINTLGITDSVQYNKVLNQLADQYVSVNTIHDAGKAAISAIRDQGLSKEDMDEAIKKQESKKAAELRQLHGAFVAGLEKNLTADQIEKIKDGMTYRVFPVTYTAYQDMIPSLTAAQKDKIYGWLKEARELAMDEGSSEDKHKVFGKYKGRINNYLSSEGYDMKKEEKAWQQRIKESQSKG